MLWWSICFVCAQSGSAPVCWLTVGISIYKKLSLSKSTIWSHVKVTSTQRKKIIGACSLIHVCVVLIITFFWTQSLLPTSKRFLLSKCFIGLFGSSYGELFLNKPRSLTHVCKLLKKRLLWVLERMKHNWNSADLSLLESTSSKSFHKIWWNLLMINIPL